MRTKLFHLNYRRKRFILLGFAFVLLVAIYFFKSTSFFWRSFWTIIIMIFFYAFDHFYDIRFRKRHYVFMFVIVVMSFLASPLYYTYSNYDKAQHFIQPMLVCSLVFYMINKQHLQLKWKLIFTFFIVVAILGLFEIGEFSLDYLFDLKMQGVYLRDAGGFKKFNLIMDPLQDTMIDMLLGVIGVAIYSTIFGIAMKRKLNHRIFREF